MKKIYHALLATILLVTTAFIGMQGRSALAATGQMYLTPANPSVQSGNNVTVSLRINPGATVDGVQATVNFDTSALGYVSADTSGSAFSSQLQQSQSGGTITIARGDFSGGISSDSLIETITFKALASSGSSPVTLTGANATDHTTSTYTNPSVANATVAFTAAPAPTPTPSQTCPTGQIGAPPNCTTPSSSDGSSGNSGNSSGNGSYGGNGHGSGTTGASSGGASPGSDKTTPNPAPPSISAPTPQYSQASLTVTSSVPTQVYAQFGIDQAKLLLQTPLSPLGTSHVVSFESQALIPGETYYYVIVTKDQSGNIVKSSEQSFTTKGLSLKVAVLDQNHQPLRNKLVELHSAVKRVMTDTNGYATFTGITPGDHHVVYTHAGKTYQQAVSVRNNVVTNGAIQTAAVQNASVIYGFVQHNYSLIILRLSGVLLLLAAVAIAVWYKLKQPPYQPVAAPTSIQPLNAAVNSLNPSIAVPAPQPQPQPVPQPMAQPVSQLAPQPVPAASSTFNMTEHLNGVSVPSQPAPGTIVLPQNDDRREG